MRTSAYFHWVDHRECSVLYRWRPSVVQGSDCVSSQVGQHHSLLTKTIRFIFLYSPAYNLGYNALTYSTYISGSQSKYTNVASAYLVELFPYHARAKGIAIFQWWGRAAGFFNQFVNPIGIANAGALTCNQSLLKLLTRHIVRLEILHQLLRFPRL